MGGGKEDLSNEQYGQQLQAGQQQSRALWNQSGDTFNPFTGKTQSQTAWGNLATRFVPLAYRMANKTQAGAGLAPPVPQNTSMLLPPSVYNPIQSVPYGSSSLSPQGQVGQPRK